MDPQALARPAVNRVPTVSVRSTFARLIWFIAKRLHALFSDIVRALEDSQRRKAARLIRQYRHLLNESDGSSNKTGGGSS